MNALATLLDFYAHVLAAAWVVNRECCRDSAKGLWRAGRPSLRPQVEGVRAPLRLRQFQPLEGQFDRETGKLFDSIGAKFNHALKKSLDEVMHACHNILTALKSSPG